MIVVKPGQGCRVQLPGGRWVPDASMLVDLTTFIRRRINAGDLVVVNDPPLPAPKPAPLAPTTRPVPTASTDIDQGAGPLKGN